VEGRVEDGILPQVRQGCRKLVNAGKGDGIVEGRENGNFLR